jgi:NAD+ diphosphatase
MLKGSDTIVFACDAGDEHRIVTDEPAQTPICYVVNGDEVAPLICFGPFGPKLPAQPLSSLQALEVLLSVQLSRPGEPPRSACLLKQAPPKGGEVMGLRVAGPLLDPRDAALAARGAALLNWHLKARFCQTCGGQTEPSRSGLSRQCLNTDCKSGHFPRIDTVVITLPVDGSCCLPGRQSRFPAGLYSGFAGFVEPGETLEQASRRETREEAGVTLSSTVYRFSQPWPFSHGLATGFRGQVRDRGAARADNVEIADVKWFRRHEIAAMPERRNQSGKLRMPGPISLAHQPAREWLSET